MAHPRRNIREKVVSVITAATPAAGSRVYDSRTQPVTTAPFVIVTTPAEEILDNQELGTPTFQRLLTVHVECVESGRPTSGTLARDCDDLAREVEEALAANRTLDGLVLYISLASTNMEAGDDIDPPAHSAVMVYEAQYLDSEGQ